MLVLAILISLVVKTFFVQAFFIPSGSMEPVLHGCDTCVGDRVLVNKLTDQMGGVHRGDIVVFHDSNGWLGHQFAPAPGLKTRFHDALTFIGLAPAASDTELVKRVIGVGGDTVEGRGGEVYLNGTQLHETYVHPGDRPTEVDFKVTVPVDTLWVMGDHRSASGDSRFHQQGPGKGFVPVKDVAGRVIAIVWPPSRVSSIP